MKTWNLKGHCASFFTSVLFSEANPKIILESKKNPFSGILQNSIGRTWWISVSVLVARHYFPNFLRLIAVTKNSHRRCSIQKALLKNLAILTGKHQRWSLLKRNCKYHKIFKNTYFVNMVNGCFCATLLLYLPSFSKFIQNYYFMFSFCYYVT